MKMCIPKSIGAGRVRTGAALTAFVMLSLSATEALTQSKDAEPSTLKANADMAANLPFGDTAAFQDAQRGFIATLPGDVVPGSNGNPSFSPKDFSFIDKDDVPKTVNPSLWRQARLNAIRGLFKVVDRVYQVRGYDISNMTIIEGDTGIIIIDTLRVAESARAALELYYQNRPRKPVVAVIYTHSHADHFGGVKGVIDDNDVHDGKVQVIAPDHFMDYAVAENVIAGNAMNRRVQFQMGGLLPRNDRGLIDVGLGKAVARGTTTLIAPTTLIKNVDESHVIDGVKIDFHLVPDTEAPSEMVMYFPQFKVINAAEIATQNLHQLYTLRGAEVRDGRMWSHNLDEMLQRWGYKADALIAQHHWPTWGTERIVDFLKKQRDVYKFINDQSLRLLNQGYTPTEIAETLKLPRSLAANWSTRGYYGTLSHNAKAVYQKYLGWYNGNPADLSPLPRAENARKTIAYMGGADAAISKAREDFRAGEYRWVATVMNDVVFADPQNQAARDLEAEALEQLGYQSEAATWRNEYLVGAMELRSGVPAVPPNGLNPDMLKAIPLDLLFDFMGIHVNAAKAEGKKITLNWNFTDINEKFVINLENSALTQSAGREDPSADASLTLTRATFDKVLVKKDTFFGDDVKISGDPQKLRDLLATFDEFSPAFSIMEPLRPEH
jgi:alkyl sulfatase BDS1-like metallo-beta-lactamase superfamily hydrolase